MSTLPMTDEKTSASRVTAWSLLAGGAFFLAGGQLHPQEDVPGAGVKEQLRVMYEDPAWYPSHTLLLIGMALLAAGLVAFARGPGLQGAPRARRVAVIAAVTASLAAADMLLHLVAAAELDRIVSRQSTPITDVHLVVETITVPAFSFSVAALAVAGAATRSLGNWVTAVPGILGGIGYGLAGGTAMFTDRLDFLFPTAVGVGLWALAAGIGLLLRRRTAVAARTA
jgi:hypothetical protein